MLQLLVAEELDSLVYGHVEYVVHVLSSVSHFQDVVLEPFALAGFAGQGKVSHKLHFDGYIARSLTFLASSSLGIEGEVLCGETHLLGKWLVGKERTYGIVCLQIGGRIASRTLADRVLVYEFYVVDGIQVAFYRGIFAWCIGYQIQLAAHGRVEDALDE